MRILAIETSCDETAAAVVENGNRILSSTVSSQVDVHRLYGGVVPELASRCHIETIDAIVRGAIQESGHTIDSMDAVAVTHGPGLVGCLLVGLSFAKGAAFTLECPLVGVNHLEGHIRAAFIENPAIPFPAVALVVSGGHTALYLLPEEGVYRLLAKTRDDAAGEAFDKVAKLLDLGYPGGPVIDRIATEGDDARFAYPLPKMRDGSLDFSFSGLKTATLRYAQAEGLATMWARHTGEPATLDALPEAPDDARAGRGGEETAEAALAWRSPQPSDLSEISPTVRDLSASFQRAAVRLLVDRTTRAAEREDVRAVILSGGVACNTRLRADLAEACSTRGISFHTPSPGLCTDNAAMIAAAAFVRLAMGETADLSLNAEPTLRLGGPEAVRHTLRHR